MTTVDLIPAGGPDLDPAPGSSPGRGVLVCDQGWLPLQALSVTAEVAGADAAVTVRQRFANPTTDAIEAVYIHPLPDRAAVVAFAVTIGDRRIEGRLRERGEARAEYDQALAAGHRAAITEEDRPDVFTTRVGNLLPGDVAEVELTLVQPVAEEDGQLSFRFPLVVAPRYIPGSPLGDGLAAGEGTVDDTDAVPDASRITPPVLLPGVPNPVRLELRAVFAGGVPDGLASSLHAVVAGDGEVALRPGERLNRDVILRWPVPAGSGVADAPDAAGPWATLDVVPDSPHSPGPPAPGLDGDGTFTVRLTAPPVAGTGPAAPRDVVVLLDRSGSMSGWKMAAARRAAARIVDSLGPADRFTVLAFDHVIERPRHLPQALIEATDRNRWLAVEWLAGVEADGGTELWPALAEALRLLAAPAHPGPLPTPVPVPPPAGGAGTVEDRAVRRATCLLVTDGQVGNEDQILAELGRSLGQVQVFTVGIDRAVNTGFLRRLAAAGGGRCELVESEDRLDEAMGAIHRRIADAPLRSVSVQAADGTEILELAPAGPVDCFSGVPLVIRGRYRGAVPTVRWSATGPDGAPCGGVVAAPVPRPAGPGDHQVAARALWARARIRDLEDHLARNRFGRVRAGAVDRIVALSLATGVLSRFTAFVAVDLSETVDSSSPRPVVQPVERPSGWAGAMPVGAPALGAQRTRAVSAPPVGGVPAPAAAAPAPLAVSPAFEQAPASALPASGGQPPVRRLADRVRRSLAGGVRPPASGRGPAVPGPDLGRYSRRLEELVARIEGGERGNRLLVDLDELADDLASIGAPPAAVAAIRALRAVAGGGAASSAEAVAAARAALAGGGAAPVGAQNPVAPRPDFWR